MSSTNCNLFHIHLPRQQCQLLRGMDALIPLMNCNFIAYTSAQAITRLNYPGPRTHLCPWLIALLRIFRSSHNLIWRLLSEAWEGYRRVYLTKSQTKVLLLYGMWRVLMLKRYSVYGGSHNTVNRMARRRRKILDILQLKHGGFTRFGHALVPGTLILRPQILKIFACGANFLNFFQKP